MFRPLMFASETCGGRHGNDSLFSSWLGLLTLIERLRAAAASPSEEPSGEERS